MTFVADGPALPVQAITSVLKTRLQTSEVSARFLYQKRLSLFWRNGHAFHRCPCD